MADKDPSYNNEDSDTPNEESKNRTKELDWRDESEVVQVDDMNESDVSKAGFHPPCAHCGSTVFRQEVTTTTYVECDEAGELVD